MNKHANLIEAHKARHVWHPMVGAAIGNVRGKGLMLAIECVRDRKTEKTTLTDSFGSRPCAAGLSRGLALRWASGKVILSSPLTYTCDNVDETVAILDVAFAAAPI